MEQLEIKVNQSYSDKLLQENGFEVIAEYKDASRIYLNQGIGLYAQEYCGNYIIRQILKKEAKI